MTDRPTEAPVGWLLTWEQRTGGVWFNDWRLYRNDDICADQSYIDDLMRAYGNLDNFRNAKCIPLCTFDERAAAVRDSVEAAADLLKSSWLRGDFPASCEGDIHRALVAIRSLAPQEKP